MIIWLDDDRSSLDVVSRYLQYRGYQIRTAATPEEFYELLGSLQSPKGIIMDIMLPTGKRVDKHRSKSGVHTGWVILQDLNQDERYCSIPVVIYTILTDQKVKNWASEHDIPYLKKQNTRPNDLESAMESAGMQKDGEGERSNGQES